MACNNCNIKPVWEFTNQTKLCRKCFIDYLERKIFRTIRKYEMLSGNTIKLKKENTLNHNVLKNILEQKFQIKPGNNFVSENLSEVAEKIFSNIIKGKFEGPKPKDIVNRPLFFVSDKEVELYASLKSIKGKKRKQNKKIINLFKRFSKNPDLEHNIVNSFLQLR